MAMLRSVPSIIVAFGVLVMSLPGGSCFLWAELGAEHHHHGGIEQGKAPASCFHEHDCDDQEEMPSEHCDSNQYVQLLALSHTFKVESLCVPESVTLPLLLSGDSIDSLACPRTKTATESTGFLFNLSSPPAEVILCRFLI